MRRNIYNLYSLCISQLGQVSRCGYGLDFHDISQHIFTQYQLEISVLQCSLVITRVMGFIKRTTLYPGRELYMGDNTRSFKD